MLSRLGLLRRDPWPLLGLWVGLAASLSAVTVQVRDWFDMTDELRYERLAIAIARTHSLIPRIHGVDIKSFSQLYPLLIAPMFRHGLVPTDLRNAHLLNAWIMSSACIPAFLLARRVTGRRDAALLVAVLTVCTPWILYASFLLTEVAAYPAFLWAILALQRMAATPSARNDLIAILAVGLAFFARTAFIILAVVPPLAVLAFELGREPGRREPRRVADAARRSVATHRLLAGTYALLAAGALVLIAIGRFSSIYGGVYGSYGEAVDKNLIPPGFARAFAEHLATLSLGVAVFPVVLGVAWLLANLVRPPAAREAHVFACIGSITVVAVVYQATTFDLSLPGYFVHDRFMFHLVPLVLVGVICALRDARRPRWSLAVPATVIALGFAFGKIPIEEWGVFPTLNPDTPASAFYTPLVHMAHTLTAARVFLVLATVWVSVMFVLGGALLRRTHLAALVTAYLIVAFAGLTIYTFDHLFRTNGLSGRPVTQSEKGVFDWVDEAVGTTASVAMIPYPTSSKWFVSQRVWRDYEWWNKSVDRDVHYGGGDIFEYTGIWFPKLYLQFNPNTGAADMSPAPYVLSADQETRFHIAGKAKVAMPDVTLTRADEPWRADWLSFGLYDDGWTKPGVTARVRIFPEPGQRGPVVRYLTLQLQPPDPVVARSFVVTSDLQTQRGVAVNTHTTFVSSLRVCVPARGFADVRLTTPDSSYIPGDQRDEPSSEIERQGGLFVNEIAVADEVGPACRVR
jgi:hypothetical protein